MMKKRVLAVVLCLGGLAACARTSPQPSMGQLQTEVARQLTQLSAATQAATETASANPEPVGPTITLTAALLPTDTPTLTPTATNTLTATPPIGDPVLTLGNPTWSTRFTDSYGLYLYEDDAASFNIVDQKFVMIGKTANSNDRWTLTPSAWILDNYYLEMTATTDQCDGLDHYGFVFGIPYPADNPVRLARLSCNGSYSYSYYDNSIDSKFHYLKQWTSSPSILAGSNQTNRLGVQVKGNTVRLYANGNLLAEINDPQIAAGRFGMVVGAANTPNFTVRLSNIAYWVLP